MHALVESGSITRYFHNPKSFILGDVQYPAKIFSVWTSNEKAAIGLYEVTFDDSNKENKTFYINTDQTFTYDADAGTVTAAYGSATAKALADVDEVWTQEDIDNNRAPEGTSANDARNDEEGNQIVTPGLKTKYKTQFNIEAAGLLALTDWYVVKATEVSDYSVPSSVTTYRAAVRTKVNAMETAIDNCANVAALITLLTYTKQDDGTVTRPLGEFPDKVV
tara:strand:- start:1024 stop:1686 length:663 start_codon:yes stop_codon:yes gene_type:complete